MSTNTRPVAVKPATRQLNERKGILYYTVGTQQMDTETGEFFIDETVVKEAFDLKVLNAYLQEGKVIQLEGEVLEDYLAEGFSYVDANNGATNSMRKLRQIEAAKADVEKENAMLKAAMAEMQAKATTVKTKGGSNG